MFCPCGSVTKTYHDCLAGLVAAKSCRKLEKLKCLCSFCYVLGTKLGGVLLLRILSAWRAWWLQDFAESWKKLKYLDFSRDPEGTLGTLRGSFCNVLGTKLSVVLPLRKRRKGIFCRKLEKVKCLDFSRDPEGALGTLRGSFCNLLGTKLGGVLPLRKRHKGISCLLGGLGGCKILRKAGNAETSRL